MANFSSVTLCQPRAWISTFWMNQEKEKKHVHCFFLICKRHLYSRIEFSIELQRWRNSDRLFWDIEWLQLRQTSPGEPPPQGGVLDVFLFEFWGKHLKRFPVFYLKKWWGKGRNINFSYFYIGFAGRVRLDSVVLDSVKTTAINTIIIMFCCNLCKINCASENIKYESWVFCVNSKIINSSRIVCKVWNFISDIIYTLGLILVWNDNPLHFFTSYILA